MARTKSGYGPVITCGAAAVSLSNDPDEPSSIEGLARAIKKFVTTERPARNAGSGYGRPADQPSMAAQSR